MNELPNHVSPARVADLSRARERLRVTGADRVAFLHGQCTNDIARLTPGQSCYAAFLTAKGKMRGEGHIVCLADAFLVETNPGLRASLEKFIVTDDVEIADMSATLGEWLMVDGAGALPADAVTFAHALGLGVIVATPLAETLSAADLETLRIEAGVPQFGVDMDETTIPVEAGLAKRGISYDKGCYVGQETIARIKTYGHVNRHLVQLVSSGATVPARAAKILAADGREVGAVTSAVLSARFGGAVALGYVRRECAVVGAQLNIEQQTAEVRKLCGE